MDWIKRNLGFVIGSAVALALLGAAGWYFYSAWKSNNEYIDKLNEQYAKLGDLIHQNPHPGRPPQSDNVKLAKEQQQQLHAYIEQARKAFERVPSIPEGSKIAGQDFITALRHTIDQLQKAASNSSITVQSDYGFSFAAQRNQMNFKPGTVDPLATQLGEVKAICDALFQARINQLDYIRRERVAPEDVTGAVSDYLNQKSVTNELAVLTPYEIKFRCFTPELAATLSGFSSSPYALLVKTINVDLAPAPEVVPEAQPTFMPQVVAQPVIPPPVTPYRSRAAEDAAFRRRYGLDGSRKLPPTPQPVAPVVTAPVPPVKTGLPTVLDEKQLAVTMVLNVVKLLPPPK
jgi:hypothetical protein